MTRAQSGSRPAAPDPTATEAVRLRTIFEAVPEGVALIARDGRLLDINPAGLRLIEADPGSPDPALRLEALVLDPERTACRELAERVFRGEAAMREIEIEGFGGTRRWLEAHATPLLDADGTVSALVCVARDITARKAAESALRDSEARWRGVFGSPMIGILFWDRSGAILDANDAFLQIVGYTREDLAAGRLDWIALTPPELRARDLEMLGILVATGYCEPFEKAYVRKDGTRVHVLIGGALLEGSPERGVAFVQDITTRKQAEEQLRESESRFRNIAEHSPVILWVSDASGACTYVNQNWLEFSGQTLDDALGFGFNALVHPDDIAVAEAAYGAAIASHTSFRGEYRVRRRDGVYRQMIDTAVPRFGPGGEFLGFAGSLVDIQDHKDAEEARQRLEAPLRQAQKMEALGTLAGGVAHDFNNILATIIGHVELARDDLEPGHPAQDSLAEIARSGARARDLVQQILTFSRRQPDERRVIHLREVVAESVRLLRATLPAGIELVTAYEDDVPNVLADRSRIHQVLLNLCTNAWQAIDGAVGRIAVSLAPAVVGEAETSAGLRPGRYACLTVSDTGRGIDAGIVERIFDPFFTTKAPGQGTGLGLSVVDGIVKGHGGAIRVDRGAPGGATFRLYFPAVEGAPEPAAIEPRLRPQGRGQRVLYVDDEPALATLVTRLLERVGYAVEAFTRPADALAAFAADPGRYDVVVSDMNMPTATGLSVAAEVLRRRPGMPVALVSGFLTEDITHGADALGVRAVIYKPHLTRDLAPLIGRLLA